MSYRKSRSDGLSPAARITAQIVERLEAGVKPWVRPWRGAPVSRPLRACGTPYRGINVFWLWMVADMHGYASPFWMTYAQAAKLGGQVRKGEKASIAIFYKSYSKEVDAPSDDAPTEDMRRVLRAYAKAIQTAEERARCSYFDQHIVRSMHGHYWVADEGDYETEFPDFERDIVHTVPSTYSDEY